MMVTSFRDEDLMRNLSPDGCAYVKNDSSSDEGADVCTVEGDVNDGEENISCPPNSTETELEHGSYSNHDHEEENTNSESKEERAQILSKQFKTSDDAYLFYHEYARHIGFSVRKDIRRLGKNGVEVKRRFVCSCQGQRDAKHYARENRKRKPRRITRSGCCALFEVTYDNNLKLWNVNDFISEHNHSLAPYQSLKSTVPAVGHVLVDEKANSAVRYSELMFMCKNLCSWASQTAIDFESVKRHINSFPKPKDVPSTSEFDPEVPLNEALDVSSTVSYKENSETPAKSTFSVGDAPLASSRGHPNTRIKPLNDEEHNLIRGKLRIRQNKSNICCGSGHNKKYPRLNGYKAQDTVPNVVGDQDDKNNNIEKCCQQMGETVSM